MKAGISVTAVVCIALLITFVFFCILRKHKNKKDRAGEKTYEDMNPVYGLYECDPDPQAEVEDTNDYYDCMYEEGTAVTRDNNSMYES